MNNVLNDSFDLLKKKLTLKNKEPNRKEVNKNECQILWEEPTNGIQFK